MSKIIFLLSSLQNIDVSFADSSFSMENSFAGKVTEKTQSDFKKWESMSNDPALRNCLADVVDLFPEDCLMDQTSKDILSIGLITCHKNRFKREYLREDAGKDFCSVGRLRDLLLDYRATVKFLPSPENTSDIPLLDNGALDYSHAISPITGRSLEYLTTEMQQSTTTCMHYLNDEGYADWRTWFTHLDSVCFYVQSTQWQRKTEGMVNRLTDSVDDVNHKLSLAKQLQHEMFLNQKSSMEAHALTASKLDNQLQKSSESMNKQLEMMQKQAEESFSSTQKSFGSLMKMLSSVDDLHRMLLGEFFGISSLITYMFSLVLLYAFSSFSATKQSRLALLLLWLGAFTFELIWARISTWVGLNALSVSKGTIAIRYICLLWAFLVLVGCWMRYEDPWTVQMKSHKALVEKLDVIQSSIGVGVNQEEDKVEATSSASTAKGKKRAKSLSKIVDGRRATEQQQSIQNSQTSTAQKIIPTLLSLVLNSHHQNMNSGNSQSGQQYLHQNLISGPFSAISSVLSGITPHAFHSKSSNNEEEDCDFALNRKEQKELAKFEREFMADLRRKAQKRAIKVLENRKEEESTNSSLTPSHYSSSMISSSAASASQNLNSQTPPTMNPTSSTSSAWLSNFSSSSYNNANVNKPSSSTNSERFTNSSQQQSTNLSDKIPYSSNNYYNSNAIATNDEWNPFTSFNSSSNSNPSSLNTNDSAVSRIVRTVRTSVRNSIRNITSSTPSSTTGASNVLNSSSAVFDRKSSQTGSSYEQQLEEETDRQMSLLIRDRMGFRPRRGRIPFFDPLDPNSWQKLNGRLPPPVAPQLLYETAEEFTEKIRQSRLQKVTERLIIGPLSIEDEKDDDASQSNQETSNVSRLWAMTKRSSSVNRTSSKKREVRHPPTATPQAFALRDGLEREFLFGKEKKAYFDKKIEKIY
eukprot:GDKK01050934.1.p1 GENE.GDKK01050934.1~~GDKK01050934.1.p1  ORF type:complete len:923 (-),score=233.28 GDKK01050934.1:48-2816(-)